ncbi:cupin domain-containing protein [Shewanella kaireitica]|uniref:cupin domain-containing protein n=1 Tax=Shewanella kaireitica TaxID=212021 RepID=UPI00200E512D|nr:cupin domain-containing protein [Shewanella kaireitica]MCL1092340.1 cupin domain-containing protein [Shewanella kaireitica]
MDKANILGNLAKDLTEEQFEVIVNTDSVLVERIISKAHVTPAGQWYDQERSEWVMVMQGAAKLEFKTGEMVSLKQGDYVNIGAHVKHRVAWTSEQTETIWLAVHY